MIEKYLVPVSPKHRAGSIEGQILKMGSELNEVDDAACQYEHKINRGESPADVATKKYELAMEIGDMIIAGVTALDMLNVPLAEVLRDVYKKNDVRGYYSDGD